MHFSAELSVRDTSALVPKWHQCRNARHFGTKHRVPKCLGSEVS